MKTCFVSCHYPPLSRTYRRYQFARLLADGGCDVEVVAYGNVSLALGSFIVDRDMMEDDPEIRVHRPAAIPWHLAGEFLYRTGLIPCSNLNWLFTATRTAASIVQSTTDAVLGIYPPVVNHLAAARAAQRTGAKLVLDFRDEYLGLASGVRRPWARLCEKRLVEKADLISVATEELGKRLMERYHLPEERIHLTLNGYWQ